MNFQPKFDLPAFVQEVQSNVQKTIDAFSNELKRNVQSFLNAGTSTTSSPQRLPSSVSLNFASITNSNGRGDKDVSVPSTSAPGAAAGEMTEEQFLEILRGEKFKGPDAKKLKELRNEDGSRPFRDCKTWADVYLKLKEQEKVFNAGLGMDSWNSDHARQWREVAPSRLLRPRAEKLLMRKEEVARLELDLMGQGAVFTPLPLLGTWPFGGLRDFAFGIFARGNYVESSLGAKWGRRDPDLVLSQQAFFDDVVAARHNCELTLMVHVSREMPLADLTRKYGQELKAVLRQRHPEVTDLSAVDRFVGLFDPQRISPGVGWLTSDCKVKEGTKLLLTSAPDGALIGEVISPGRVLEQRTTLVGATRDPLVSESVFQMFLGPQPLSAPGKALVGKGCLFVANGHQFPKHMAEEPRDAHTWFGDYKPPEAVEVDATPEAFHLPEAKGEKGKKFLSSANVLKGQKKGKTAAAEGSGSEGDSAAAAVAGPAI